MHDAILRDATHADAAAIAAIYNVHVRGTIVTFELEEVDAATMAARIDAVRAQGLPWRVADAGGVVLGYAYAGPWKARAAYARTAEASIYLREDACGQGLGTRLYRDLLELLRAGGIHAVIGGAALPNAASVALHEALGFGYVGTFPQVGRKFDRWIDVGYWQRILEGA